jgi:alkanesulfonate monooxygenase
MVTVYTTSPATSRLDPAAARRRILQVAEWTEAAGWRGLLVYNDNSLPDPWAVAQIMIEHTETIAPLVAINPVYSHPFTAARSISTLARLYGRGIDVNLVVGGFDRYLRQLGCDLEHDARYARLAEFGAVLGRLLTSPRPVSHSGQYYQLSGVTLSPVMPTTINSRILVSGTSEACARVGRALGAVRLAYPHATRSYSPGGLEGTGIRLGLIPRDASDEAWRIAHQRFPVDRRGEKVHKWAATHVESAWHRTLSQAALASSQPLDTYWLYPFRAYKTFCPYLIGTYQEVSDTLRRYFSLGVSTVILDEPTDEDDVHHAAKALTLAKRNDSV